MSARPGWGGGGEGGGSTKGSPKSLGLMEARFSVSDIPDTIGDHRSENKMPPLAPVGLDSPWAEGRGGQGERVTGKRLWSGPWLEPRKAFKLEVTQDYLEDSLSCFFNHGGP